MKKFVKSFKYWYRFALKKGKGVKIFSVINQDYIVFYISQKKEKVKIDFVVKDGINYEKEGYLLTIRLKSYSYRIARKVACSAIAQLG